MILLGQLIITGMMNSAIYCLLAIGFGIVYRSMRFFYLAYGAIYVLAAYIALTLNNLNMPIIVICILSPLLTGFSGILLDKGILRPLENRNATSGVLLIASLGFYIVLVNILALIFGNEVKMLPVSSFAAFSFGPFKVPVVQCIQFVTGWFLVVLFWSFVKKNTFFKGIWAMGEASELVRALGLPYKLMRSTVFFTSSVFAGIAAVLTTLDIGMSPHGGMQALLIGAVIVFIGGVDSIQGWIAGAILLAILQSLSAWAFSVNWNPLVVFSILIITLLFRPNGIFSPKKRLEIQ